MKIAVYPGSFHPFHIGHIAVIEYLLGPGCFDMVYLVVTPRNPFKEEEILDSAAERLSIAREAVSRRGLSGRVKVDDIEFSMPVPSYSIDTLDALRRREGGENSFTLVIGGDNLRDILSWKQGERILQEYGVVVYPREGCNMTREAAVLKRKHANSELLFNKGSHHPLHIKLLKSAPLVNVSATQIREKLSRGEDVSSLLA